MTNPAGPDGGERIQHYQAWFWGIDRPLDVKFAVEKAVHMLLTRTSGESGRLVFAGTSASKAPVYRSCLRLEAVEPGRHLYWLQMEAAAAGRWFTQENLQKMAERAWQAWIHPLQAMATPPAAASDRALYEQVVRQVLAREAELANTKEDEGPIQAARQAILDAFRLGKRCCQANKEGVTTFRFDGRQYSRDHMGDWDEHEVFNGADALLADLRRFYYWEIHRDTYPHSPPEVEAWRHILGRMQ